MKSDKVNKVCFDPEADELQVKTKKGKKERNKYLKLSGKFALRRFGSESTL